MISIWKLSFTSTTVKMEKVATKSKSSLRTRNPTTRAMVRGQEARRPPMSVLSTSGAEMTGSELRPKFIDVHPAYNSSGYIVTNEEPETLRGFIAGKKLKRSGGIASGGEILLSVLLPQS